MGRLSRVARIIILVIILSTFGYLCALKGSTLKEHGGLLWYTSQPIHTLDTKESLNTAGDLTPTSPRWTTTYAKTGTIK